MAHIGYCMGKVIEFPKKIAAEGGVLIKLQAFVKSYVIDLTKIRKELVQMRSIHGTVVKTRRPNPHGLYVIPNPYISIQFSEARANLKLVVNNVPSESMRKKA